MPTYTDNINLVDPDNGQCNWKKMKDRNSLIQDALHQQKLKDNSIIYGGELSVIPDTLAVNATAGKALIAGFEFDIYAGPITVFEGDDLGDWQHTFIYIDSSGALQTSTTVPVGSFALLGVADASTLKAEQVSDLRALKNTVEDYGFAENILINPDLSGGPGTINQRNFNGDWASLPLGSFGYDRWYKPGTGYISQRIAVGNYEPNAEYAYIVNGALSNVLTAPASGSWVITSTDTNHKLELIKGNLIKPVRKRLIEEELNLCLAYFWQQKGIMTLLGAVYVANAHLSQIITFPQRMRQIPTISYAGEFNYAANTKDAHVDNPTRDGFRYRCISIAAASYTSLSMDGNPTNFIYADAELTS